MPSLAEPFRGSPHLHIAIGAPLSGPAAALGREMAQAAQLAVDRHHSTADACDPSIGCIIVDDAGTPDQGAIVAQRLAADTNVLGVVGHYNSDVTIAASTIYAHAGLPMITPVASNPVVTNRQLPGIFRWTNRDDRTAIAIAAYVRGVRHKGRAVIVESETAYGRSMADQFERAFVAAGGGEIVQRRAIRVRSASRTRGAGSGRDVRGRDADDAYSPDRLIHELPSDFDLLFYGGSFDGAPLLKAMRAAGRGQLFAAGDGCWDVKNFLEPAGAVATAGEGVLVLAAALAVGVMNGSADFASRYTARYGPIGNYALNAYDATCLLLNAVTRAAHRQGGRPTRGGVIEAIRDSSYQGLSYRQPVRFDAKGDNLSSLTVLNIVVNGQFTAIAEIAAT